jgi:uncharacterized protein YneF (UPF0154 family)
MVAAVGIFIGVLIGLLMGMLVCARYLRQEMAANIGPKLERIEQQLRTLQAEFNLDSATRLARLTQWLPTESPQASNQLSDDRP